MTIERPFATEDGSSDAVANAIFDHVMSALQPADELGGPDRDEYCILMEAVARECLKRRDAAIGASHIEFDSCAAG